MTGRIFLIITIVSLIPVLSYGAGPGNGSGLVRVNGSSQVVDIKDILAGSGDKLSGNDIKRICAEITDRYHQRGYTAFYVKEAVLNKDGTADLFFNESVVTDVILTGLTNRGDVAAESVFKKGDLFNEYILKENISLVKNKFNLKKLNITVKRGEDDQIVLVADAVEKVNEIDVKIYNSPLYGIVPGFTYRIDYRNFTAGASAESSFNLKDRSCSSGSVFFNSDNITGSYFTLFADMSDKRDSITVSDLNSRREQLYRHRSFSPGGGFCYIDGAAGVNLSYAFTMDQLKDYPGPDNGVSFSGLKVKLFYNNGLYKIDFNEITSGEIDFSSGWNFIEKRISSKIFLNYRFSLPVYSGLFFSFNGNFFYTSDNERYSHIYVFDGLLPCRGGDFSSASWKNVSGADLVYEAITGTLYISPVFKWGVYNAENRKHNITASGIKFFYNTGRVKMEMSYLFDLNNRIRDGFLMLSAAAYL